MLTGYRIPGVSSGEGTFRPTLPEVRAPPPLPNIFGPEGMRRVPPISQVNQVPELAWVQVAGGRGLLMLSQGGLAGPAFCLILSGSF